MCMLFQDKWGNNALIEACENRHAETARVLLDHGAAVDYCNKVWIQLLYHTQGEGLIFMKIHPQYGTVLNLHSSTITIL